MLRSQFFTFTLPVCLCIVAAIAWIGKAGDLTPPAGAPTGTMKTLDEVEPRKPIHLLDLPLTISSSGSYYLAENISTAGNGITIAADDVTIDLMGLSLSGGSGTGISESGTRRNIAILNGTLRGWSGLGCDLRNSEACDIRGVRAVSNVGRGIWAGTGSIVKDCIAALNGDDGIRAGTESTVTNCVGYKNSRDGIRGSAGAVILNCTARENSSTGIVGSGANVITGCTASMNGTGGISTAGGGNSLIADCSAFDNTTHGIRVLAWTVVRNCNISNNFDDGIVITGKYNTIHQNTCSGNNQSGIVLEFNEEGNRVESNSVSNNTDRGIDVDGTSNVIIRNDARGNGVDYDIAAGNVIGQILDLSAGGTLTSSNSWANIKY